MKPVTPKYRAQLNALAAGIDKAFNGEGPSKVGFAILLFEFNEIKSGRMNWISNADRESMIVALKEMIGQLEARVHKGAKDQ